MQIEGPALVIVFPLGERPYVIEAPDHDATAKITASVRDNFPEFTPVLQAWVDAALQPPDLRLV